MVNFALSFSAMQPGSEALFMPYFCCWVHICSCPVRNFEDRINVGIGAWVVLIKGFICYPGKSYLLGHSLSFL